MPMPSEIYHALNRAWTAVRDAEREAEDLKTSGHLVDLYNKEGRWYAGEDIPGWRPFRERGGFVRA